MTNRKMVSFKVDGHVRPNENDMKKIISLFNKKNLSDELVRLVEVFGMTWDKCAYNASMRELRRK